MSGAARRCLARRRARRNAPEPAGSIDVIAIGDIDDLSAVARPHRIDLMIISTVVVARQLALVLAGQALDALELAPFDVGRENMKALVVQRRHENDAPAVGRESRLDIDS